LCLALVAALLLGCGSVEPSRAAFAIVDIVR